LIVALADKLKANGAWNLGDLNADGLQGASGPAVLASDSLEAWLKELGENGTSLHSGPTESRLRQ